VRDTSVAAEALQARIHRGLTGAERLQLALDMSELARELCVTRLRRAHPEWTDRDLKRELLRYAFLSDDGTGAELPPPLR
jgi:hypothetical protein